MKETLDKQGIEEEKGIVVKDIVEDISLKLEEIIFISYLNS